MTVGKRDREAVFVAQEGRSALTGEELGADWQIDHRQPRAAGGGDDITNLQALSADENRAKSCAQPPHLRRWQREFLAEWERHDGDNFLLVALPGAGKTVAALTVAQQWIEDDPERRRVLIVVPTDALRTQWQREAAQSFGLQFQARDFTAWKPGMVGAVATYQLIRNETAFWRLTCSKREVLVVCDEIHHASDYSDWGVALKEAVGMARRRLVMSGTPFRGDSRSIPFVSYDSAGQCVPNHRYDYPNAIRDGVIRVVRFQHDKGIVREIDGDGAEESAELSSDLPDEAANAALSKLLEPGGYTEEILRRAHEQLRACRRSMPNAGALAICKDQFHAERIVRQLEQITGERPDLVVSDNERATSTVESFRASDRAWVVAVRQISEGIDIKRLMVLAYLTNYRTALFFRQAVGRIVRYLGTEHDQEAYCFIPDHPLLVRHAEAITTAQVQAIVDESEREFTERLHRELDQLVSPSSMVLSTEHAGTAGSIIEGERLDPEEAARTRALARDLEIPERAALKVLRRYGFLPTAAMPTTGQSAHVAGLRSPQRPLEDQLDDGRRLVAKAVSRAVRVLFPGDPNAYARVHDLVNRKIGRPREAFSLLNSRDAVAYLEMLMKRGHA